MKPSEIIRSKLAKLDSLNSKNRFNNAANRTWQNRVEDRINAIIQYLDEQSTKEKEG